MGTIRKNGVCGEVLPTWLTNTRALKLSACPDREAQNTNTALQLPLWNSFSVLVVFEVVLTYQLDGVMASKERVSSCSASCEKHALYPETSFTSLVARKPAKIVGVMVSFPQGSAGRIKGI